VRNSQEVCELPELYPGVEVIVGVADPVTYVGEIFDNASDRFR
jgi:hypothetical protein